MNDVRSQLLSCFQAVFPALDKEALPQLSQDQYSAWDSLQSVILIRVIEEQFHIQLDLYDLEGLTSFEAVEKYLKDRISGSAPEKHLQ